MSEITPERSFEPDEDRVMPVERRFKRLPGEDTGKGVARIVWVEYPEQLIQFSKDAHPPTTRGWQATLKG